MSSESAPLVSVVIPSYNHYRFICGAADSVLAQSHTNLELIIIDDGSTDGTPELLSQRYGADSRVRLVARENQGAHATLNEGVGMARGDYVSILNSDDLYLPGRLEKLVQLASQRGKREFFAITALRVVDEHGAPSASSGPTRYYGATLEKFQGLPDAAAFWVGNLAMTTSNFFFSRELYENVGKFSALRYTHDWDWALRASERVNPVRLGEVLVCYRVHGSNTIAESNMWKHVAENAYVFASAIQRAGLTRLAQRTGLKPSDVMRALLANESFGPVPTLFLLGLGQSEAELGELLAAGELERMMPELARGPRVETDLMLSAEHLRQKLAARVEPKSKPAQKPKTRLQKTLGALRKARKQVGTRLGLSTDGKRK
jgi:GT2 family glycosyltransferase